MNGVVLYDGACEFCSRWLRYWTPLLRRNGYNVETLQEPWVATQLGMPQRSVAGVIGTFIGSSI